MAETNDNDESESEDDSSSDENYNIPITERKIHAIPSEPTIQSLCERMERGRLKKRICL